MLVAMLGRFEEARLIVGEGSERWPDLGGDGGEYGLLAEIATLSGDHEAAAGHLRTFCDRLEQTGQRAFLSSVAPLLGRSLCMLGRHDEAEPLAHLGRDVGADKDVVIQVFWRQVQALVHASRGEYADAERLAREAIVIAEQTDALSTQGEALCDLAHVLQAAGRRDEAAATLDQALERYERKKNLAMARQVREHLGTLRGANAGAQLP